MIDLKNKVVVAPLAGYTNLAYRKIMKKHNAGLVYTEMISCKGLLYDNDKTWYLTKIDEGEHPVSLQLFGGEKEDLVRACKMIDENSDCDIIDINMGCPNKKVLKCFSGSYMLKDIDKTIDIVEEICKVCKKPVSVKIRLGWDHSSINCVEFAKRLEKAGVKLIAIHGRTKSDLYSGKCNLDYIKKVKEAVKIPVIGNGDIKTVDDALYMLEYTGCDAVMIGRAAIGNPWLIEEIDCRLNNKEFTPPTFEDRIQTMLEHYELLLDLKGEKIATMEMRSIAGHYVKGVNNTKDFRIGLINCKTKKDFLENLNLLVKTHEA